MKTLTRTLNKGVLACAAALLAVATSTQAAHHMLVDGTIGQAFVLTAKDGHLPTPEGGSIYFWGLANGTGEAAIPQYPGVTMIVNQGVQVTVTLHNTLPQPVSLTFLGQKVTATGGEAGLITQEATAGHPVTYTFTPSQPGTYLYHSATRPELQTEMGLVGALIVRPAGFDPEISTTWTAYGTPDSKFDNEFLFLLTEMDHNIHVQVEKQVKSAQPIQVDTTKWFPVYWFINGRNGPDTMFPANVSFLPNQPYNCMPMQHPGQKTLMRLIGAGRDSHPFHHHGNHSRIIARDGRLLASAPGAGADLSHEVFTIPVTPGSTFDAIWSWTGEKLGWDVYGHKPGDALEPHEYAADHGKPFPVMLPPDQDLTRGAMYGGSPFLGLPGALPPGEGGFNPTGGFMYMWHSHAEKEICNNNIFPGGMLTMALVEAWMPMTMP